MNSRPAKPPQSSSSSAKVAANSNSSGGSSTDRNDGRGDDRTDRLMRNSRRTSHEFVEESASYHLPMNDYQKNSSLDKRNHNFTDDDASLTKNAPPQDSRSVSKGNRGSYSGKSKNGTGPGPVIMEWVPKAKGGAHSGKTYYAEEGRSCSVADSAGTLESGESGKAIWRPEISQENTESNFSSPIQNSTFFDICPPKNESYVKLKAPLLEKNRELRKESSHNAVGYSINVLRPGMLLLKQFLSLNDQVKVIKKCKELGIGPGGFYIPGYQDGAKLKLKMMCLGKNWDPATGKYGDIRPCDGSKPPLVPEEFHDLVQRAMNEAHSFLMKKCKKENLENILPSMKPDICIVNFYLKTGRLGLHQDKDESEESLSRGLPVVSFSIGDSAEFLYGDKRDVDTVKDVVLESGDVLIFGGRSRHVFHGVSTIFAGTAPEYLSEETNILPGRLNLTFREY